MLSDDQRVWLRDLPLSETPADDQDMDAEAEQQVATESAGGKVTLASMDDDLDFD